MESVKWKIDSCNRWRIFLLLCFLLLSPVLSFSSSRVASFEELLHHKLFDNHHQEQRQSTPVSGSVEENSYQSSIDDDESVDTHVQFTANLQGAYLRPGKHSKKQTAFAFGHQRKALGENQAKQGLEVQLLHRHHPGVPKGGRRLRKSEHLPDRILLDKQRQMRQKQQLRATLARRFPKLATNDPTAGNFEFLSPVVSGSGLGSGQYFIDFYLGTPAQKFSLIADTGSDIIWVQCVPCISCYPQIGALFNPRDSSTYNALSCSSDECQYVPPPINATCDPKNPTVCDYAYAYSDGSQTIGVYALETATMNVSKGGKTVRIDNVAVGCGYENGGGPSLIAAGGIIGLGLGILSFPSQIGNYFSNKFSYCLVNYLDAPTISSTIVFGELVSKSKEPAQSTPFILNPYIPSLYYVGIQCVSVGGTRLSVPSQVWQIDSVGSGGTVVDSGTTLTIFLQAAYGIILNAFESQISCYPRVAPAQGLDFCFDTSSAPVGAKISHLPSFSIVFDSGAVFNPPNDNVYVSVTRNIYCLAMAGSPGPFGYNVLGNLIQQNFEITYDRQDQKFAFAPAQCSQSS